MPQQIEEQIIRTEYSEIMQRSYIYYAMSVIRDMAKQKNDTEYIAYIDDVQKKLGDSLAKCWDEDRFIRGIREDGVIVGAKKDPEANMWLNPQSWSVISKFASESQADGIYP